MKNLLIILALLFSQNAFSNIDTLKVKSKISDVTVFLEGAQVMRTSKLNLPQGKHYILFEKLPYEINPESIQVEGMENCKILSVKHKYSNPYKKSEIEKNIQSKIDSEQLKYKEIASELSVFNIEEQLLLDNRILSKKGEGSLIKEIKEAADFYRLRLNEIKKAKLNLNLKTKAINKNIKNLYSQLNKYSVEGKKIYSQVLISLECEQSISNNLILKYYVSSAGWTPTYDYRVEDISKPLVLVYNAKVFQSTGENWKNVKLKLSTNNPSLNNNKPELLPWYIERGFPDYKFFGDATTGSIFGTVFAQRSNSTLDFAYVKVFKDNRLVTGTQTDIDGNYVIKSLKPGIYKLISSFIGYKEDIKQNIRVYPGKVIYLDFHLDIAGMLLESVVVSDGLNVKSTLAGSVNGLKYEKKKRETNHFIPTTVNKAITNLEYEIEIPYSIPSDGINYNIKMKEISIPVEYIYHVIPKIKSDAFLIARIPDWSELNLLSGKSSTYYQGTFIGESTIDANQTSDTLNISLGKDSNVIVERKVNKRTKGKKFLSKYVKEIIEWDIILKNKKDTNINIVVQDQFPISENKSIDVELLETSNSVIDEKKGTLTWKLNLDSGKKQNLSFKYSVKYPKKMRLSTEF